MNPHWFIRLLCFTAGHSSWLLCFGLLFDHQRFAFVICFLPDIHLVDGFSGLNPCFFLLLSSSPSSVILKTSCSLPTISFTIPSYSYLNSWDYYFEYQSTAMTCGDYFMLLFLIKARCLYSYSKADPVLHLDFNHQPTTSFPLK